MFQRIKNWLEKNNGKYIIANEQGEPLYIIMSTEEYDKILENKHDNPKSLTREELMEKINKDIDIWKSSQNEEISEPVSQEQDELVDELVIEEVNENVLSREIAKKLANF
ncbi:hypothetical protein CL633_03845 [bacterium]|nr:hypothetical protein [bacterium]|tara:strand:- start:8628 stop:8957 length:330 start_codon:yes stop_codon:yes gene_type:complete